MKYNMYCIYDKVSESYGAPFLAVNDATAIRQFLHQIAQNLLAEPTDFELYGCGLYDISSAEISDAKLRFVRKGSVISNG